MKKNINDMEKFYLWKPVIIDEYDYYEEGNLSYEIDEDDCLNFAFDPCDEEYVYYAAYKKDNKLYDLYTDMELTKFDVDNVQPNKIYYNSLNEININQALECLRISIKNVYMYKKHLNDNVKFKTREKYFEKVVKEHKKYSFKSKILKCMNKFNV